MCLMDISRKLLFHNHYYSFIFTKGRDEGGMPCTLEREPSSEQKLNYFCEKNLLQVTLPIPFTKLFTFCDR